MESTKVTLANPRNGGTEPKLAIFYNQTRPQGGILGHQPSHKVFAQQFPMNEEYSEIRA